MNGYHFILPTSFGLDVVLKLWHNNGKTEKKRKLVIQSQAAVIKNETENSYCKIIAKCDRSLLQRAWGITKRHRLFLQSVSGVTKSDRLLQSYSGITKCDSNYKERRNKCTYKKVLQAIIRIVFTVIFKALKELMRSDLVHLNQTIVKRLLLKDY